ncbi:MAG: hypothetical protein DU429_02165 [Candidatus Tokpelaia sp.]|uniref:hypothetical protein n=1 Tax=Candidatus Tokpelaia sp. TaxID=2233777 RepID=UPI00123BFCCB|nr:hypothetical protein [Candidatus Tokpelaia sp.]KAA6205689.1 MAG: hypothetical protein DU430_03885 [Candidatus Tokpelaia sp.]KAA6207303.1 MAG: hypothetical protein DU429_02165 [Candidatus Tokpelaia sp.]
MWFKEHKLHIAAGNGSSSTPLLRQCPPQANSKIAAKVKAHGQNTLHSDIKQRNNCRRGNIFTVFDFYPTKPDFGFGTLDKSPKPLIEQG